MAGLLVARVVGFALVVTAVYACGGRVVVDSLGVSGSGTGGGSGSNGCKDDGDCNGGVCANGVCMAEPACVNEGGVVNTTCGGACPPCLDGQACAYDADCLSGSCINSLCRVRMLVSQVRTRGLGGASDEFVELYNPGGGPVVMDASWTVVQGGPGSSTCDTLYVGTGLTVPAHGHLLLVGSGYTQAPPGDAVFLTSANGDSIGDAATVAVQHGGSDVDRICMFYDTATLKLVGGCGGGQCDGEPINNYPHDGTDGPQSDIDRSVERKPGGAAGNGQDTNEDDYDFTISEPAQPRNTASPPTP